MLTKYILPLIAVVLLIFAVVHVTKSPKPQAPVMPLAAPRTTPTATPSPAPA